MNRIITFLCILLISSCTKENFTTNGTYDNTQFFLREKGNSSSLIKTNSIIQSYNNDIVDTIISELKSLDLGNKFSKKIEKEFGLPKWNKYLKLNNSNKLSSVFIPIVDTSNKINMLLFAYQNDKHQTFYKFINRNTLQKKLKKYGDQNATLFTQQSLEGIYKYFESLVNDSLNLNDNNTKIIKTNAIKSTGYYITYSCWSYNWAYTDNEGVVYVGASIPQCTYTITMTNSVESDLIGEPYFQGGSGANSSPSIITDPCLQAKEKITKSNDLTKDIKYVEAYSAIMEASSNGNEHTITLYKNSNGEILKTNINTSNSSTFCIPNSSMSNSIADLHNHPNSGRPSEGDLYSLIDLAGRYNGYDTRYILFPNGDVYALVIDDYTKASTFAANNPKTINPDSTKSGTFPEVIQGQMLDLYDNLVRQNFSPLDADLYSFVNVLTDCDTGLSLLKKGSDGKFSKIMTSLNSSTLQYVKLTCL